MSTPLQVSIENMDLSDLQQGSPAGEALRSVLELGNQSRFDAIDLVLDQLDR